MEKNAVFKYDDQETYKQSCKNIHDNPPIKGDFFITFSLQPEFYTRRARQQYLQTIETVKELLKSFSSRYLIVPELTKAGNIHYHCHITPIQDEYSAELIQDAVKSSKKLGNTFISPMIKSEDSVHRVEFYLQKDIKKTYAIINNIKDLNKFICITVAWKRTTEYRRVRISKPSKTVKDIIDKDVNEDSETEQTINKFVLEFND